MMSITSAQGRVAYREGTLWTATSGSAYYHEATEFLQLRANAEVGTQGGDYDKPWFPCLSVFRFGND